jgi:hypothetical protein
VSEAIAKGDVQAINYFVAQKYVDALTAFATSPNQKTFLMPVEATGIIGALAGIGEIARATFGDGGGGGGTPSAPPRRPTGPAAGPTGGPPAFRVDRPPS